MKTKQPEALEPGDVLPTYDERGVRNGVCVVEATQGAPFQGFTHVLTSSGDVLPCKPGVPIEVL